MGATTHGHTSAKIKAAKILTIEEHTAIAEFYRMNISRYTVLDS